MFMLGSTLRKKVEGKKNIASSANYISQEFVYKYIDIFRPCIIEYNSSVRLDNSTTELLITHIITLNISFVDNNSLTHEGLLNFSVMYIKLDFMINIESIMVLFMTCFLIC